MPRRSPRRRGGDGDGVVRRHALVVGVRHTHPELLLPHAAEDAAQVTRVLSAHGYQVTTLHDGEGAARAPTRAAVLAALRSIMAAADEDDLVLVYFCCHGIQLDERRYLLFADTDNSEASARKRGLRMSLLLERLRGRPRWVGILLDVCKMGLSLEPGTERSTDHGLDKAGGFALLAGSTDLGVTQDADGGGGIFTACLVDGLSGALADERGGLRFSALARHVQAGVERWRESDEGRKKTSRQRPVLRLEVADLALLRPAEHVELSPALPQRITAAAFSPDGSLVAAGAEDGQVRCWIASTGAPLGKPQRGGGAVRGLAFVDDGRALIGVWEDGTVMRWAPRGGHVSGSPPARLPGHVEAVAWAADGSLAAVCEVTALDRVDVSRVAVEDLSATTLATMAESGHELIVRDPLGQERAWPAPARLQAVAFVGDDVLVTSELGGAIRRWSRTGEQRVVAQDPFDIVTAIAASPDGQRLALGGRVRIHALATGAEVNLREDLGDTAALAFLADGAWLANATTTEGGRVRIWDAATGQRLRELPLTTDGRVHRAEASVLVASPVGRRLFVGYAGGRARVVEV